MSSVRVRVKTTRRYGSRIPSIVKDIRTEGDNIAYEISRAATAAARRNVHKITWNLYHSIKRVKVGHQHHKIVVGEHYGVYEEYGNRYRPGHPFLRPAIEEQRREFVQRARGIFTNR